MIKVSIIEDHKDFRNGVSYLLKASDGYKFIASYDSVEEGLQKMSGEEEVLLLDINLPKLSGVEAIPILKAHFPDLKIIMLTVCDDDDIIMNAIQAGADGYLLKKTPPTKLLNGIKECITGGSPMNASIAQRVLMMFKKYVPVKNDTFSLSEREQEVLQLLVDGLDNDSIAKNLYISIQTVRNHIRHIYDKLHVHTKSQAVVKALREGLV